MNTYFVTIEEGGKVNRAQVPAGLFGELDKIDWYVWCHSRDMGTHTHILRIDYDHTGVPETYTLTMMGPYARSWSEEVSAENDYS